MSHTKQRVPLVITGKGMDDYELNISVRCSNCTELLLVREKLRMSETISYATRYAIFVLSHVLWPTQKTDLQKLIYYCTEAAYEKMLFPKVLKKGFFEITNHFGKYREAVGADNTTRELMILIMTMLMMGNDGVDDGDDDDGKK